MTAEGMHAEGMATPGPGAGIKKHDAGMRRDFNAAIGAEVERLRGVAAILVTPVQTGLATSPPGASAPPPSTLGVTQARFPLADS